MDRRDDVQREVRPIPDRKPPADAPVPVTVENFIRAESDFYFAPLAQERGAFGKLLHVR